MSMFEMSSFFEQMSSVQAKGLAFTSKIEFIHLISINGVFFEMEFDSLRRKNIYEGMQKFVNCIAFNV